MGDSHPSALSRPGFPAGLRVIVVDEGPGSSNAVQQLEALSYKATKCTSVAEAISQTILSPEPDVCLLEAKYIRNAAPGCATFGEALDRVMEAGPANPASPAGQVLRLISRLPTVLMSTDDSPDIIIGSVKAGAVDFICKPLPEAKLKTIWQHVVRRSLHPGTLSGAPVLPSSLTGSPGCHVSDGTQPSGSNETMPHLRAGPSDDPSGVRGSSGWPGPHGSGALPHHPWGHPAPPPDAHRHWGHAADGTRGMGGSMGPHGAPRAGMPAAGQHHTGWRDGPPVSSSGATFVPTSYAPPRTAGGVFGEYDLGHQGAQGHGFGPISHATSMPDLSDLQHVIEARRRDGQTPPLGPHETGPLGLKLRKSESFVSLVQACIGEASEGAEQGS